MPRVLVVDDEQTHLRAMSHGLSHEGFEVASALGADEALEQLALAPFELALVDLMMPRVSGLELARTLRARFPRMRVVLTGAAPLSRKQIDRLGLDDVVFVPKPLPLPELARRIRDAIAAQPMLVAGATTEFGGRVARAHHH